MSNAEDVLRKLLEIELARNASKLQLITAPSAISIREELLYNALSELNELSINKDELSQRRTIAIAALLWSYRNPEWGGLQQSLVLFLSRAGFGPSSIMLDPKYSREENSYSFDESLQNKFAVALSHANHEIKIQDKIFLLSEFQKSVWNSIAESPSNGISAPTSAGKSYLILLKTVDLLLHRQGVVIYIVPTLSLVNQVLEDYRKILDQFGLNDYFLHSNFNPSGFSDKSIYVLTQEKAIAAFSADTAPFERIRLLVIDEIQNVERAKTAEEQRAKILYDLMMEFRNHAQIDHIILSGPRIVKIDELGNSLFGIPTTKNETQSSPVLNLTYSISKRKNGYYLSLITDLLPKPLDIKITREEKIIGYGKVMYPDDFMDYLDELVKSFGDEHVLIFAPTSPTSRKIAIHISNNTSELRDQYLNDLSDFIAGTVHPQFSLVDTIKSGIVYHHGKLPFHVRILIEDSIKKGLIKTIVSTTTLLQGVNLPVQNIIIRNPNLFLKKGKHDNRLTNYELANLRGRAGRLLKDFVGRTFILDESQFNDPESKQLDLFKDTHKELNVGYGTAYQEHKRDIKKDMRAQVGNTAENKEYSYLTTYLRQTVMRYGINAQSYLARVGINLSNTELNDILSSINELDIEREICSKNRYWDPVDLNELKKAASNISLPTSAFESGISYRLVDVLTFLGDRFPSYYNRYFGIDYSNSTGLLVNHCILAENWLKEKTLAEILSAPFYDDADKIDNAVNALERTISYGMSLLLRPLYDIARPGSVFPRFIEAGAFRPLTRRFIELNVPRETAIFLSANTDRFQFPEPDDRPALIGRLRLVRRELSSWHQIQLNSI